MSTDFFPEKKKKKQFLPSLRFFLNCVKTTRSFLFCLFFLLLFFRDSGNIGHTLLNLIQKPPTHLPTPPNTSPSPNIKWPFYSKQNSIFFFFSNKTKALAKCNSSSQTFFSPLFFFSGSQIPSLNLSLYKLFSLLFFSFFFFFQSLSPPLPNRTLSFLLFLKNSRNSKQKKAEVEDPVKEIAFSIEQGWAGTLGFFPFFLDRAPGFFLRIFTGNFWIFLRARCPPAEICSRFSLFGGVFLAFFGFSELLPSLSRGHFEKNGQVLG